MGNPVSNEEWIAWGKKDPLFGVASWPGKERGGAKAWTDEEFYALGAKEFSSYIDLWQRYGLVHGACVEIGCGAGRMTRQLSQCFERVEALDVSPDMITYARAHVPASNISWHVVEGDRIPLADTSVTGAFSCHVFQHFANTDVVDAYFSEMFRVIQPGGTLLIHLPLYRNHLNHGIASVTVGLFKTYEALNGIRAKVSRLKMRIGGKPYMHVLSLEENALGRSLAQIGFSNIQFVAKVLGGKILTVVLATR